MKAVDDGTDDAEKLDRFIHRSSDQSMTVGDGQEAPHNLGYVVMGRRYDDLMDMQPWEREILALVEFSNLGLEAKASRPPVAATPIDELGQAVRDLGAALWATVSPPLEAVVSWLARILRRSP